MLDFGGIGRQTAGLCKFVGVVPKTHTASYGLTCKDVVSTYFGKENLQVHCEEDNTTTSDRPLGDIGKALLTDVDPAIFSIPRKAT